MMDGTSVVHVPAYRFGSKSVKYGKPPVELQDVQDACKCENKANTPQLQQQVLTADPSNAG